MFKKFFALLVLGTSFFMLGPSFLILSNGDVHAGIIKRGIKKGIKMGAKGTAAGIAAPHIAEGLGMKNEAAAIREMQRMQKDQISKAWDDTKKFYNIFKQNK